MTNPHHIDCFCIVPVFLRLVLLWILGMIVQENHHSQWWAFDRLTIGWSHHYLR